ncbi:hypothetical protein U1Q18_037777 [Sarracenia purpurea var. burkii]
MEGGPDPAKRDLLLPYPFSNQNGFYPRSPMHFHPLTGMLPPCQCTRFTTKAPCKPSNVIVLPLFVAVPTNPDAINHCSLSSLVTSFFFFSPICSLYLFLPLVLPMMVTVRLCSFPFSLFSIPSHQYLKINSNKNDLVVSC